MRCVAQALLLAAVVAIAGCSLFRDPYVYVADITSITAPDTVHTWTTFDVTVHAILGNTGEFVVDHMDINYTSSGLTLRIWSRDLNRGRGGPRVISEGDYAFGAGPLAPGEFRVVAHQPDGSTTQKTITILP
jgi:hypothetical protein